ncbi:hypothetical protein [Cognatiluteimonas weifangensis]|uniref:hypothetical protein n=1 Tax=Cognatiluteimonas weifangensis TaxID=2303539 RepID=UPI0011C0D998|nr:hypothetical protein [Luteimonas weifangensis]
MLRPVRLALFVLALALPSALAVAQTSRPALIRPAAAPVAVQPAAAIDQTRVIQRRLKLLGQRNRALESRVATLEEALREMRARTELTCSGTTSVNGRGGSDDCTPYACNHVDGRCRVTAAKTEHCAPGFVWNGGNQCVAPPPADQEKDCGFLGFGCL